LGVIVQQSAITTSNTVCNTRTWIQFSSSPSGQSLSWLLIKYINDSLYYLLILVLRWIAVDANKLNRYQIAGGSQK
jgi:hypothetical protein